MRTGLGSYTFPWAVGVAGFPAPPQPLRAPDLLAIAAARGVSVVQIADNLPLHCLDAAQLVDLRKQALHLDLVLEAGTRGVEPAHLHRYLQIAVSIGARFVRTMTHSQESTPDLETVESWLREVLPEFTRAGVSIGIENYERHTARQLAAMIERIGSDSLGACLDTVNSFGAVETPEDVLDVLGPYAINVHVKDFVIERVESGMGFRVRGCAAGEGLLDIKALMSRIDAYGRKPNYILEQWTPFAGSIGETIRVEAEWAAKGIAFLDRCLSRAEAR